MKMRKDALRFRGYSKASNIFFKSLIEGLDFLNTFTVLMGYDELPLVGEVDGKKRTYYYDFTIPELKLIIEYNGVMFHPRIKDTFYSTVEDSIKKDNMKKELAKNHGYDIYCCWENQDLFAFKDQMRKIIKEKYEAYRTE